MKMRQVRNRYSMQGSGTAAVMQQSSRRERVPIIIDIDHRRNLKCISYCNKTLSIIKTT